MENNPDSETVSSYLSPGVRHLITQAGICNQHDKQYSLTAIGLLDWNKLESILSKAPHTDDDKYFESCVLLLAPSFKDAEVSLENLTTQKFEDNIFPLFKWTGLEKTLGYCYELLKSRDAVQIQLSMLVVSSVLERALGDIYLLKGSTCPSMLKDLLMTSELSDILGPAVIQTLRTVIGPPTSLNLRNIMWHGFPSPGEIPARYGWFLLLLIPSIGQILQSKNITDIVHRCPVDFLVMPKCLQTDISSGTLSDIMQLLKNSKIIPEKQLSVIHCSFQLYLNQRYGFSAVLVLPVLEHALRQVFSSVNKCPQRVQTAEATTLYTTFDEILSPCLETGEKNLLADNIGEEAMNMLLDVLEYPAGPRVRDKLSHGEVDLWSFPVTLSNVLLTITLFIAAKCAPSDTVTSSKCVQSVIENGDSYKSVFHPVSLVQQKVMSVVSAAAEINRCICYTYKLEPRSDLDDREVFRQDSPQLVELLTLSHDIAVSITDRWSDLKITSQTILTRYIQPMTDGKHIMEMILSWNIKTLYRFHKSQNQNKTVSSEDLCVMSPNKQAETVNLLHRTLAECDTIVSQIQSSLQTKQKQYASDQLSTRQTDSLHKLISCCPCVHVTVHIVAFVMSWQLYSLDTPVTSSHSKLNTRFLKNLLQHCENIRTFTAPNKNRWTESVELSVTLFEKIKTFVNSLDICFVTTEKS